ncbi:hypothetical protein ACFCP7_00785 [Paenibacillus elgii]
MFGRHQGLIILGVPCKQFGEQEPGSEVYWYDE